ncbi:MAG TPA: hypothetical protein VM223_24025 [Planctomycetota bacterium]|nr:hypothetical protein [Planctomycetota bacterium]
MHMAVEGGAEAMQEGDGPEPRAGGGGSLGCRCRVCGGAEQSLDLGRPTFLRPSAMRSTRAAISFGVPAKGYGPPGACL